MPALKVVRTYLEMTSPGQLRPAPTPSPAPRIERLEESTLALFRLLSPQVGRAYRWTDRLAWSDSEIQEYLRTPGVWIWLMSWEESPAGYFELREHGDRSVEIGTVMFGRRNPETGEEIPGPMELVRLAIPRRVYTQSHIDYVVEAILQVWERRETVSGYRFTEQAPVLRHFTARFEELRVSGEAGMRGSAEATNG